MQREPTSSNAAARTLKLPAFESGSTQQHQAPLNSPQITSSRGDTKTLRAALVPGVTSRLCGSASKWDQGTAVKSEKEQKIF